MHYRGPLERFKPASTDPSPAPRFPFGGVHLDFTHLADPPLQALQLPQPRLERLLDERARELGADIRRGHKVVGVNQDDATVTADVRGPDGPYRVTARYLVGCDGAHSRVRDMAGIPFPGNGYSESFNGRFRDEFLSTEQFDTLLEAQVLAEDWRIEYNTT